MNECNNIIINEKEEEELYNIISSSLFELCREKPLDPIYFLSSKMLELTGIDIKTMNLSINSKSSTKDKLMLTTIKKMCEGKKFHETYNVIQNISKSKIANIESSIYLIEKKSDNKYKYCAKIINKNSNIHISETNKDKLINLDHKNLAKIVEIEEDDKYLYFIYEYCKFGNLKKYLEEHSRGIDSEFLLDVFKQMISAIAYLNENNIVYGSIKLENILIHDIDESDDKSVHSSKSTRFVHIKLADVGKSFVISNKNMSELTTKQLVFLSPEEISNNSNYKSDVWSLGILFYYLYSGKYPFNINQDVSNLIVDIINKEIDFSSVKIPRIKDILKSMLIKNHLYRIDSFTLMDNDIFKNSLNDSVDMNDNKIKFAEILEGIKEHNSNDLSEIVLNFILSNRLYNDKNFEMNKLFQQIDSNNDGSISSAELLENFTSFYPGTTEVKKTKIKELMAKLDINQNGKIDYSEFIFLSQKINEEEMESTLQEAFNFLDISKSGYIDMQDLLKIFKKEKLDLNTIQEMINDYDSNLDGKISFEEFKGIITKIK